MVTLGPGSRPCRAKFFFGNLCLSQNVDATKGIFRRSAVQAKSPSNARKFKRNLELPPTYPYSERYAETERARSGVRLLQNAWTSFYFKLCWLIYCKTSELSRCALKYVQFLLGGDSQLTRAVCSLQLIALVNFAFEVGKHGSVFFLFRFFVASTLCVNPVRTDAINCCCTHHSANNW